MTERVNGGEGDTSRATLRVLIADDHPLFRMGLALALKADGFEVVAEAENGRQAVERAKHSAVDVVLLDVRMPELDGIDACRAITSAADAPVVVMLTTFEEPAVVRAARAAGASAYLSKETNPRELARKLRQILSYPERDWLPEVSLPELTPRETEALTAMARGLSNKAIASELGISPETVKDYIENVYRKLDVRDRVSAVRRAAELGLVSY